MTRLPSGDRVGRLPTYSAARCVSAFAAYMPSGKTNLYGSSTSILAVGKPMVRPIWFPCTTLPEKENACPSKRLASCMSLVSSALRILEELMAISSISWAGISSTSKPPVCSNFLRKEMSPSLPAPKRWSYPMTMYLGANFLTKKSSTYWRAGCCENASEKGTTTTLSMPERAMSAIFSSVVVSSLKLVSLGLSIARGCGSKVMTTLSPSCCLARACTCSRIRRWPRCTPSKDPMVMTALRNVGR